MLAKKKEKKRAKKLGSKTEELKKQAEGSEDSDMASDEGDKELDQQLEHEIEEAKEANNPDTLDETIFNKFAGGELDLPEGDDVAESEDSEPEMLDEDSELEAYYEELGIDANEMHDKRKKKGEEKLYRK